LHQHGFYKGRGCKTAWEEVLTKVLKSKDIYEFDLKGFFPSVEVRESLTLLEKEFGLPAALGRNLLWLSQTPPKLPPGDYQLHPKGYPLDEELTKLKIELDIMGGLHSEHKNLHWTDLTSDDSDLFKAMPESIFATKEFKITEVKELNGVRFRTPQYLKEEVKLKTPKYVGALLAPHFQEYGERSQASKDYILSKYGYYDEASYYLDLYRLHQPRETEGNMLTAKLQAYERGTNKNLGWLGQPTVKDNTLLEPVIGKTKILDGEPFAIFRTDSVDLNDPSAQEALEGLEAAPELPPDFSLPESLGTLMFEHKTEGQREETLAEEAIRIIVYNLVKATLETMGDSPTKESLANLEFAKADYTQSLEELSTDPDVSLTSSELDELVQKEMQRTVEHLTKVKRQAETNSNRKDTLFHAGFQPAEKVYPGVTGYSHYSELAAMNEFIHSDTAEKFRFEGFPQGSPISPILCSMILQGTVFAKGQCLMYADDGLFYGTKLSDDIGETTAEMKKFNLSFAADKSKWVKKDGIWLEKLKFLGLTFIPSELCEGSTTVKLHGGRILQQPSPKYPHGRLVSSTKKGATLEFDKYDLIRDFESYLRSTGELPRSSQSKTIVKLNSGGFYPSVRVLNESKASYKHYMALRQHLSKELPQASELLNYASLQAMYVWDEDPVKRQANLQEYNSRIEALPEELKVDSIREVMIRLITPLLRTSKLRASYEYIRTPNTGGEPDEPTVWEDKLYSWIGATALILLGKEFPGQEAVQTFSWDLLVKSGQFGFIQSRLYNDEWNTEAGQDFTLTYKPDSWAWYAQHIQADLSLKNISHTGEAYPDYVESEEPDLKTGENFFNQRVHKTYGYLIKSKEDGDSFHEIPFKEFMRLYKTPDSKLSQSDLETKGMLEVRVTPKYPIDYKGKPFLSVFNSTSYALPCLVNLFALQSKQISWTRVLSDLGEEIGISKEGQSALKRVIHLGFSPIGLLRQVIKNPELISQFLFPGDARNPPINLTTPERFKTKPRFVRSKGAPGTLGISHNLLVGGIKTIAQLYKPNKAKARNRYKPDLSH